MRSLLLLFLAIGLPSAWAQRTDIGPHVLSGGFVATRTSIIGAGGQGGAPKFGTRVPDTGVARSKGSYQLAGIEVGEVVIRTLTGNVINEFIDIPLLRAEDLEVAPQPATKGAPPAGKTDLSKQLSSFLEAGLGRKISSYSVPGTNGASSKTATLWQLKQGQSSISVRLELFFENDQQYLTNSHPHFARVLIQTIPDIESVVFDPTLFTLKRHELVEKLSLVGLTIEKDRATPAKILAADVSLKVNAVLDRLQNIQIRFQSTIPTKSIVMNKYRDQFVNVANSVISDKVRSYPTELTKTNVSYSSQSYLLFDPVSGYNYTYTDVYEYREQDVKLIWSPGRGAANYRLIGHTLEILPPGFAISKAIDPTIGTLGSGSNAFNQSISADFNLPSLSFTDLQKNIQVTAIGTWIDLPMENQGELPFCLPASMARILRYFGRQVNQFAVAKVGGVDMRGTNWVQLVRIVKIVCDKMNLKYRELDRKENLGAFVKENIDNGLPILWLVPGHARIINGYNLRKRTILYTDSWGEGFEVREMPYAEAQGLTDVAVAFLPPSAIK